MTTGPGFSSFCREQVFSVSCHDPCVRIRVRVIVKVRFRVRVRGKDRGGFRGRYRVEGRVRGRSRGRSRVARVRGREMVLHVPVMHAPLPRMRYGPSPL